MTKLHAAAEDYIYKQKRKEEDYTTYDIFEAFSNLQLSSLIST